MNIQTWIEHDLWADGYFTPTLAGDQQELFRSGISFPLITSLINGCHGKPTWDLQPSESPTNALFQSVRPLVKNRGASWFYITDPDNAFSILHWVKAIAPDEFNEYPLQEFELNPADQGGVSYLGLAFHDQQGILVFELNSEFFSLSFYGSTDCWTELQSRLSKAI